MKFLFVLAALVVLAACTANHGNPSDYKLGDSVNPPPQGTNNNDESNH